MTTLEAPIDAAPDTSTEPFADRLFGAALGAMEIQGVYLGDRLGWYDALASGDGLTSVELATRTDSHERYAREWLEHQATFGYVTVDDAGAESTARRYRLPAEHVEVLTDRDSLSFLGPLARFIGGLGLHLDTLAEAYRTGEGVSWAELGDDPREAQAALNRPLFLHQLTQELLPSVPDVDATLRAGARVADIGCGFGWSSIGLALGYPDVTVDGFDIDQPSVESARANAAARDVSDRVRFHLADGSGLEESDRYDVVFAFECIHDLSDPVGVLSTMRQLAAPDGTVIVMDEKVQQGLTPDGDEIERLFYGFSITCCLPDGLSDTPSAGTGTVMRTGTFADYAAQAGFSDVDILPIDHEMFRFYRLQQ